MAKREIMKLAEHKRALTSNEAWMGGPTAAGFTGTQTWVVNAFSFLAVGTADYQYVGNEILDPLLVFRGAVNINWGPLAISAGVMPTIQIQLTLIAANDDTSIVGPRSTTSGEDAALWVRYPDNNMLQQFNTQNLTILKRKTMIFRPRGVNSTQNLENEELRTFKVVKKLRGKKEFETATPIGGVPAPQPVLKGWNYYWVMSRTSSGPFPNATTTNPVTIVGDRYVYFRDP